MLLFTLGALVATGMLVGLAPAVRLARTNLRGLMNESGRTATGGRGSRRALASMVVAEIAVAITLVAGAGWLVRSYTRLLATEPGFATEGRLVFDAALPVPAGSAPAQVVARFQDLRARLTALPGVARVGSTTTFPLRPDSAAVVFVAAEGQAQTGPQLPGRLRYASFDFFAASGVRLLAGRSFGPDDRIGTEPVAIVNETFVRRYLTGLDPLQSRFMYGFPTATPTTMRRIVGVVADTHHASLRDVPDPTFYLPIDTVPFTRHTVVVQVDGGDAAALVPSLRAAVREFDRMVPIDIEPVSAIVARSVSRQRLGLLLMLVFAGTALALAAIGIYGAVAYASAERSGEVATRMALGATPSDVFWLLMRHGRTLAAGGAVLGVAAAYASGRVVASRLSDIEAGDPIVLAIAATAVLTITAVAIVVPARRASRVNPARALRMD